MENIKDWCISRQLWWGHRIPVFYCDECGWMDASMEDLDTCPHCGAKLRQDEDVLDTWFSSQLWTFATQGWPDRPEEMEGHHPTTVLVTARDIIALWVARMIMSSLYFTDQIPFHDVFIYATILAKDGSRMSKSKGNGVDPLDLMDKYGADAMRHALLTLVTGNQDVRFDAVMKDGKLVSSARTEASRAFVTKIWNASRFVQMNLDGYVPGEAKAETPEDAWMFSRLAHAVASCTEQLIAYNFGDYARDMQGFFWNEVCDWYIELCKGRLLGGDAEERLQVQRNLVFVLDTCMKLLHPVMPFVTESVWESLPATATEAHEQEFLMLSQWPDAEAFAAYINDAAEHDFDVARRVVSAVRTTRARYRISPKAELEAAVRAPEADVAVLDAQRGFIANVGRVSALELGSDLAKPAGSISVVDGQLEIFVKVGDLVDLAAEGKRLEKELAKAEKDLSSIERTLSNEGFVAKAAPEIIEKKKAQQAELSTTVATLKAQLADLA